MLRRMLKRMEKIIVSSRLCCLLGKVGMSRSPDKVRRKVQWNDNNGNNLVEILEFEPSDVGDSDEEDGTDSCSCTIM